jgi:hypothetical protein
MDDPVPQDYKDGFTDGYEAHKRETMWTQLSSKNKNTKKIEKKAGIAISRSKRSPKGEPMSNPLSYPRKISYNY